MSSLSPCRRPAWQAPVCDDQSVSQRDQLVAAVVQPARQVRRVAVADRAPQHVVGEAVDLEEVDARHAHVARAPQARRAWRLTMLRYQKSSSSIASSDVTTVFTTVRPSATTIAGPSPSSVDARLDRGDEQRRRRRSARARRGRASAP